MTPPPAACRDMLVRNEPYQTCRARIFACSVDHISKFDRFGSCLYTDGKSRRPTTQIPATRKRRRHWKCYLVTHFSGTKKGPYSMLDRTLHGLPPSPGQHCTRSNYATVFASRSRTTGAESSIVDAKILTSIPKSGSPPLKIKAMPAPSSRDATANTRIVAQTTRVVQMRECLSGKHKAVKRFAAIAVCMND